MTNIEKIRAALESIRTCDDMLGERDAALAALAELERAAAEPLFILTTGAIDSDGEQDDWDIECDSSARLDAFCAVNPGTAVPLYPATPPAPIAEMREPTPEECERIAALHKDECAACCINPQESADYGHAMFWAVRTVMGGEK